MAWVTETNTPSWAQQKPSAVSGGGVNPWTSPPTTAPAPAPYAGQSSAGQPAAAGPYTQTPTPLAPYRPPAAGTYDPYDPMQTGRDYPLSANIGPWASGYGPEPAAPQTAGQGQAPPDPYSYDMNGVNPNADFGYNAFLRGMGYSASTARAQTAYQKNLLQQQLTTQLPLLQQQEQFGLTAAGNNAAARGAAGGSSMLQAQNQVINQAAMQQAQLRSGVANQQAQADFGLQGTLNQLENQRVEQEIQARQRLVDMHNNQIAYSLAMKQLGY